MWDLPRPGIEPASLAVADVFLGLPLLSFTNHAAQQAILMELSRQESHSSAGEDQGAEQARISKISWQKSRS